MATNASSRIAVIIRTMMLSGFHIIKAATQPAGLRVDCLRYDEFGLPMGYCLFISDKPLEKNTKDALVKSAKHSSQALLLVEDCKEKRDGVLRLREFLKKLGGPIDVWLPLSSDFGPMVDTLGHNKLFKGMTGKPDDLFEEAVKQGLQFLFGSRVVRYGQERLFESLPDGVGIPRNDTLLLYDAKAYSSGYKFSQDSIRTFSDYVRRFNDKYSDYVGRVYAFLVISGEFADSEESLKSRDSELYASCQTKLVCLSAVELAKMVELLKAKTDFRNAIEWRRILASTILLGNEFQAELKRISKDRIVR